MSRLARDGRFEYESVSDFFQLANGALLLQPPHDGLDGCVGWAPFFGESLLDLAHRAGPDVPKRLHHLKLKPGQFYRLFPHHGIALSPTLLQMTLTLLQLS